MKTISLLAGLLVIAWNPCRSQQVVKIDVMPYFEKPLPPPPSAEEAYKRLQCESGTCQADAYFKASNEVIEKVLQQIAQPSASTLNQMNQSQALTGNMSEEDMKGMTDAQKLEYAQQKMNQSYGDNRPQNMPSNAHMDFAKQMQDPEFQKKFQKMTKEEQAAYVMKMQQSSQPKPSGKQNGQNDPRMHAAMEEIKSKTINDPKFREEFSKKPEAEQEAYIREVMNKHGLKESNHLSAANRTKIDANDKRNADRDVLMVAVNKGNEMTDKQMKPMLSGKTPKKTYADSVDTRHRLIDQWQETEIKKLPIVERNEAGSFPDQAKVQEIERQAMEKHLKVVEADLKYYAADWQKKKQELKQLVAPFNEALAKARYGEGFTEGVEGEFVKALAGYQSTMFQNVASLNSLSKDNHEYAAHWYVSKLKLEKEHADYIKTNQPNGSAPAKKNGLKSAVNKVKSF